MEKNRKWQVKQNNQLLAQWEAFTNSNKHHKKIDWSKRQRGEAKAKIIFVVNQAVSQRWNSLPTNKLIAHFAECKIRWVKKVINKFLGLRKWLAKMSRNVRIISKFTTEKKIELKEMMLSAVFGYVNGQKQTWMYLE